MLATPLRLLAERIRALEGAGGERAELPLAVPELARLLPGGRLRAGTLIEFLIPHDGLGVTSLALRLGQGACRPGRRLVVVDAARTFYPPAAAGSGLDVTQLLVVRPTMRELPGTLVHVLRCPAVGALVAEVTRLSSTEFRRVQLAAQTGGGIGLLLRPASARTAPSFAAVRLGVSPVTTSGTSRVLDLETLRVHGGPAGHRLRLNFDPVAP